MSWFIGQRVTVKVSVVTYTGTIVDLQPDGPAWVQVDQFVEPVLAWEGKDWYDMKSAEMEYAI